MVLNVAIGPVPSVSGTRTHILNIVKYSKQNFNLIECSPLSFYSSSYKGSGFLLRHKIPFIDPYGYYLAKKVLPKYDIVHTHGHPYWWDLYKKPKKSKAKYIHTVHQVYFEEDTQNKKSWVYESILNKRLFQYCKQVDVVISASKWLQEELEERGIGSVYIPNGVDMEECEKADASLFREKYTVREDFFLFVGHSGRLKRADLFIELAKKMPDRLFVMCGVGTSDISVPRNVIALGHLSRRDVLNAMAACKAVMVPSSKESFPSVLLETMSCKKPVVATNSTGMKEIISDIKDGYLFELDNLDDLYEKACKAWDNPKMGIMKYEKVKNYDWKNVIKKIDKLYENQTS